MKNGSRWVLAVLAAGALFATAASAQTVTGSISGLVMDSTNSVIPAVAIEVTDIDRNVTFQTSTNESGFYVGTDRADG